MSVALNLGKASGLADPAQQMSIDALRIGGGARSGGLDEGHVALLMESVDHWPPVVVWSDDCLVIDGAHRVEAARRLGRPTIWAVRFIGTRE